MYNMITKIINPRIRGENEMNEKTTKKIKIQTTVKNLRNKFI